MNAKCLICGTLFALLFGVSPSLAQEETNALMCNLSGETYFQSAQSALSNAQNIAVSSESKERHLKRAKAEFQRVLACCAGGDFAEAHADLCAKAKSTLVTLGSSAPPSRKKSGGDSHSKGASAKPVVEAIALVKNQEIYPADGPTSIKVFLENSAACKMMGRCSVRWSGKPAGQDEIGVTADVRSGSSSVKFIFAVDLAVRTLTSTEEMSHSLLASMDEQMKASRSGKYRKSVPLKSH